MLMGRMDVEEEGSNLGDFAQSKVVLYREMGKGLCPHFTQPFFESIHGGGRNYGRRKLSPVFHNTHPKGRFSLGDSLFPITAL